MWNDSVCVVKEKIGIPDRSPRRKSWFVKPERAFCIHSFFDSASKETKHDSQVKWLFRHDLHARLASSSRTVALEKEVQLVI